MGVVLTAHSGAGTSGLDLRASYGMYQYQLPAPGPEPCDTGKEK
jgi:hypothetical protein